MTFCRTQDTVTPFIAQLASLDTTPCRLIDGARSTSRVTLVGLRLPIACTVTGTGKMASTSAVMGDGTVTLRSA